MADESLPLIEDCGFIRVPADKQALWMTCDECGKSDHFWVEEDTVRCRCGARYSHAVRPDESTVPVSELEPVPFQKGPMQLADLELDPIRLVILLGIVAAAIVGGLWMWTR